MSLSSSPSPRGPVVLGLLVLVACGAEAALWRNPFSSTVSKGGAGDTCNTLDCPRFEVLKEYGNGVELRRYERATWVFTDVDESSYEKATVVGFNRVFKYLIGDNELEARIDMTAPVVTTLRFDRKDEQRVLDDCTVSLVLPREYQETQGGRCATADDMGGDTGADTGGDVGVDRRLRPRDKDCSSRASTPPHPRDDRVEVDEIKSFDAYVLPFGSYALGFRVKRLAFDFFDFLNREGAKDVDRSAVLVAVYDPPYKPFERHNELWVLRKPKRAA